MGGPPRRPPAPARRAPSPRARRRRFLGLVVLAGLVVASVYLVRSLTGPGLSPMRAAIVASAESQVGYRTDPSSTYCNKFSAYWDAGVTDCGNANLDEEWCADFAAWAWKQGGAEVDYQLAPGDLNSAAASFYVWGVDHHTWHPLGSGYTPQPGDVAVYGLDASVPTAQHVAVVVGYTAGDRGPDVVNGDGSATGFSEVDARNDEYYADIHHPDEPLSGYVSPLPATGGASSVVG